jgi:hypothetical protein
VLPSSYLATTWQQQKKEEEEYKGGAVATGAEEGDIKKTDNCWLLWKL